MVNEVWIELNEKRAADHQLSPGVYRVVVEEGENGKIPGTVTLHLRGTGWYTPEGSWYSNPFARFLRCKRIGDLPA